MDGLRNLLGEVSEDFFFNNYFGKKHLYLPGGALKFRNLLSFESIGRVLALPDFPLDNLRIARKGIILNDANYTYHTNGYPEETSAIKKLDLSILRKQLANGSILCIKDIHPYFESLLLLKQELEIALQEYTGINTYIGWSGSEGFVSHYDPHDVFIVQIQGKKSWQLYGFNERVPNHQERNYGLTFEESEQFVLEPGDSLYIPRGCYHSAKALGNSSIHLTIRIRKRRTDHYLKWLVNSLSENDEFFREDIPRLNTHGNVETYLDTLRRKILEKISTNSFQLFFDQRDYYAEKRLVGDSKLLAPHEEKIENGTKVSTLLNRSRIIEINNKIEVGLHPNTVHFSKRYRKLLETIFTQKSNTINDLILDNTNLENEEIYTIIRVLFSNGLIELKNQSHDFR